MKFDRKDQLRDLIRNGHTDQAIEMVRSVEDRFNCEDFVNIVLGNEKKSAPELVEAVLEAFLGTRENRYDKHGCWVHQLSHFTKILWERRMDSWIKKFNEVSLKGANELNDFGSSNRLVDDFVKYAEFDDDPAEFFLTLENLSWMDWTNLAGSKTRIEAGRFESEEVFLRWKLRQPQEIFADYDTKSYLADHDRILTLVQRLQSLGVDISEEMDMLTRRLNELEVKLSEPGFVWLREELEEKIQKIRVVLT